MTRAVVRAERWAAAGLRAAFATGFRVLGETADGRIEVEVGAPSAERIAEGLAGWGALLDVVADPMPSASVCRGSAASWSSATVARRDLRTLAGMSDQAAPVPRIVVALDGSEHSRKALRRAAIEAIDHHGRLEVLRAWSYLDAARPRFDPHYGEAKVREEVARMVDDELGDDRPADMAFLIVNDLPAHAVLEAAAGAFVVVVGAVVSVGSGDCCSAR